VPDKFFRSVLPGDQREVPKIDTSVPHIARVYDYWLGGKDNFAVDREMGDKVLQVHPETVLSVQANRKFLARAVRHLAANEGVRQFLDIGTGLPSGNNTHEVAQAVRPDPHAIVDRLLAAVPPGSFLVISHLASDVQREAMAEMGRRLNQSMTQQFTMRTHAQVAGFFHGRTLLDPGVVLTHQWRPDSAADAETPGVLWAGAARKD
jgi:hypothetical protein